MKLNLLPMMGVFTPDPYLSSPLGFYPDFLVVFGDSMGNLRKITNILTIWILDLRFISEYLKKKTKTCHWYTPSPYEDLKFSNFFWNSDYIPHSSWYRVTTFESFTKIWFCEKYPGIKIFAAMDGGPFPEPFPFSNSLESVMYTFTKRVPFLEPWLWKRRSLPGRKWRQSRPRRQPKFRQESHSSRSLQSNNTWNSCSHKWRPSERIF